MRSLSGILFFFLFVFSFRLESLGQDWKQLSSEHFFVYFTQDDNFAKDVLYKAEGYYKDIASDLGYPRYSQFWTWENRAKIYIYPDRDAYLKATGQPNWSEGMADYRYRQIISYAWSKGFVDALLPHEMAHLIFRDFVGFKGEIPLWLDEGVAQWSEEAKRRQIKAIAKQLFEKDSLMSLKDMMHLDIRKVTQKDGGVRVSSLRLKAGKGEIILLSTDKLITTYYIQAVSLVDFLIGRYGSYSFTDFCRQLREGKSLEEALKYAYPNYLGSLQELEERWREYLEKSS